MDERLAKLLQIALDTRCTDGERIAALNAVARTADASLAADALATSKRPPAKEQFTLGLEQQLELLQALIFEKDQSLAAARAEIAQLKARRGDTIENTIDLKTVIQITGLSRATLYRRMARAEFPLPCGSAGKTKLWNGSEVSSWKQYKGGTVRQESQTG